MKFFSKNFFDNEVINQSGVFLTDGYGVPSDVVDTESKFSRPVIVRSKDKQLLDYSQPVDSQSVFWRSRSNTDKEDLIRKSQFPRQEKPCNDKNEVPFYKRHFQIFDNLAYKPNCCWQTSVHREYKGTNTRH